MVTVRNQRADVGLVGGVAAVEPEARDGSEIEVAHFFFGHFDIGLRKRDNHASA